jgi:hypothetical protein
LGRRRQRIFVVPPTFRNPTFCDPHRAPPESVSFDLLFLPFWNLYTSAQSLLSSVCILSQYFTAETRSEMKIEQLLDHPIQDTQDIRTTTQPRDITSSTSSSPTPPTTSNVTNPSKTKRRQTKAACLACRQRKSKVCISQTIPPILLHTAKFLPSSTISLIPLKKQCDGQRPSCKICVSKKVTCNYSVKQGKTQQQATKERLKSYKEVVALLRQSSEKECEGIVRILQSRGSLEDACGVILEGGV